MIIFLYKILSDLLLIPIFFYFFLRFLFSKENKGSISEKFFFIKKKKPQGNLIWINGVSIGEAKTGVIIAEQIKKLNPEITILLSTSTIASYRIISKLQKNHIVVYSPLDINSVIKRFLEYWKPSSTIFIESEIWPNVFYNLKRNSVKLTLFNARISNQSFHNWIRIRRSAEKIFNLIDECFVQDDDSLVRFKKLGVKKIQRIGNLKFLSNKLEFNKSTYNLLKYQLKGKRIITLFSSHEGEEKILLNCFSFLSKRIKNLFFVIIPRHTNRIEKISEEFKKNKLTFQLKSNEDLKIRKGNFLIVNSFGELGLFFKLSEIALVGGSFLNFGGHNPIETRDFGCSLIFGKYMQNFKEVKEKILKKKAGFEVENSNQLSEKIYNLLNDKKLRVQTSTNFKNLCEAESAKSELILKKILK